MQHILILGQDTAYRDTLVSFLYGCGYTATSFDAVEDSLTCLYNKKPDLVLFDAASWGKEGSSVYRALRDALTTQTIPLIIITTLELMRTFPFSLAFDDFFIKANSLEEILLRIKQLFWRQSKVDSENILKIEDLTINLNSYEVMVRGRQVYLTYKEYELLKFLVLNRGRVFTREALLDKVWGYDNYVGTRTVDIHIQRLRTKLGETLSDRIQTVRNVGYSFLAEKR